jgi:5-methyltetrahydrofolate--homocysteine methyltransferase
MEAERSVGERRTQGTIVMATVKGDVHDIGKNIVGVVLGCNNYQVIDLGVMVPADTILDTAVREGADAIGLSGLITPSLDEMVHVAKEMERRGMELPLLIGGATTSKQHTAVKIAPRYHRGVIHVHDASRAVGVVSALLDPRQRATYEEKVRGEQTELRELFATRGERRLLALEAARRNAPKLVHAAADAPRPPFLGARTVEGVTVSTLLPFVDWTFFFATWEMKMKFPKILDDAELGPAARELYENATALLARIEREGRLSLAGVYGFWPAHSEGDDLVLYEDAGRTRELVRFPMLRQQNQHADERANLCLADYVAPRGSGVADHVGGFCVTAGLGADEFAAAFEAERDDYNAIMVKALADRLAEAFAEYLHARVRAELGHPDPAGLTHEDLVAERFRGIRPAFGYPACPDHRPKRELFRILDAERIGVRLTENLAMWPAASVSGLYLAHPEARYFNVGKLDRDQVADYARRIGGGLAESERWLGSNLAYEA